MSEQNENLYRPVLNRELLRLANLPIIQSLLYDADLLPEQLSSQKEMTIGLFAAYNRLEGVLLAFKYLEMQGIKTDLPESVQSRTNQSQA